VLKVPNFTDTLPLCNYGFNTNNLTPQFWCFNHQFLLLAEYDPYSVILIYISVISLMSANPKDVLCATGLTTKLELGFGHICSLAVTEVEQVLQHKNVRPNCLYCPCFPRKLIVGLHIDCFVWYYQYWLVFSGCVVAVKCRPILYHCVDIFFWSFGIMNCMLFTFENRVLLIC